MQPDTDFEINNPSFFWLYSPFIIVIAAIVILTINDSPGLDGAARSTAVVFWFFPVILYSGYKSIVELHNTRFSKLKKFLFILIWLIPSLPIGLASLFGIALISETGFGILF